MNCVSALTNFMTKCYEPSPDFHQGRKTVVLVPVTCRLVDGRETTETICIRITCLNETYLSMVLTTYLMCSSLTLPRINLLIPLKVFLIVPEVTNTLGMQQRVCQTIITWSREILLISNRVNMDQRI